MRSTFSKYWEDRRGNVAMTFAIAFLPALLVSGAAIDYSRALTQKSNLQQAVDATALTIAHTYLSSTSTTAVLTPFAQEYIGGIMSGATVTSAVPDQNNTRVCVSASYIVPTVLMKIAKINIMPVAASSCSQVGQTFEVSMVLDNSGSMANSGSDGTSKISALQSAAKKLVSILIPSGTTLPQVAISIVPFTSMVNVKTGSGTPAFIDTAGTSSIHWQNFHRPKSASYYPTSKLDLFKGLSATWAGCVEERPYPLVTSDTAASSATTDSMFVPYFAPDEPGTVAQYKVKGGGYYSCYGSDCGKALFYNSYLKDYGASSSTNVGSCSPPDVYSQADTPATYSGDGQANVYPGAGASMVCKYNKSTASAVTSAVGPTTGPNFMCTSQVVTPLTTDTSTLNTAIDNMVANGSTDLAAGFMWGWRSISPTVAPFPTSSTAAIGPQNPKSYTQNTPANTKVIILMTDGMNSWTANPNESHFGSLYEAFGYYANNRLSNYDTSSYNPKYGDCQSNSDDNDVHRCELDNVTLEACAKAKTSPTNIIIYTIGVSVPGGDVIDDQGLNVLQSCATAPYSSHYFKVSDSASMQTAFQQIAASILALRLSR